MPTTGHHSYLTALPTGDLVFHEAGNRSFLALPWRPRPAPVQICKRAVGWGAAPVVHALARACSGGQGPLQAEGLHRFGTRQILLTTLGPATHWQHPQMSICHSCCMPGCPPVFVAAQPPIGQRQHTIWPVFGCWLLAVPPLCRVGRLGPAVWGMGRCFGFDGAHGSMQDFRLGQACHQ